MFLVIGWLKERSFLFVVSRKFKDETGESLPQILNLLMEFSFIHGQN